MSSDRRYSIVHSWAQREGWWTNTAMVRELLNELERDRRENAGILSEAEIFTEEFLASAWEKEGFLDHVIEGMKRTVWLKALNAGLVPRELPQVEQRRDQTFGPGSTKIVVSIRCDKVGS